MKNEPRFSWNYSCGARAHTPALSPFSLFLFLVIASLMSRLSRLAAPFTYVIMRVREVRLSDSISVFSCDLSGDLVRLGSHDVT